MNQIKPTRGYLIVQLAPQEAAQSGVIIQLSVDMSQRTEAGIVIAVGSEVNSEIEVGNTVIFNRDQATPVKHDGVELIFMKDAAVIAVKGD